MLSGHQSIQIKLVSNEGRIYCIDKDRKHTIWSDGY